jgi:diguanylate cyclase (GGDEF)-like protein
MLDNRKIQAYQQILQRTTLIGALSSFLFQLCFAISYLYTGDSLPMWIHLAAAGIALAGFLFILRNENRQRLAGFLMAFSIYFSNLFTALVVPGAIPGTVNWLTFTIVVGTLTNGLRGTIFWSAVNIITAIGLVFRESLLAGTSQPLYVIADNVLIMLAVAIAITVNEQIKRSAIQRAEQLQDEMQRLATIDELTNTFNRRHFYAHMEGAITQAQETKQPLSLVLFDLDHFKQINDNYGHVIGDQVLTAVVKRCRRSIRECDILWRYGGEEFIILMPNTSLSTCRRVADRLCQGVQRDAIRTDAGFIPVTISVGVAALPQGEDISVNTLLHHVDEAMYAAKQAGRNRVMQWY